VGESELREQPGPAGPAPRAAEGPREPVATVSDQAKEAATSNGDACVDEAEA
jgi:hypothetical protein